jgi:prepilin-type N-terminal cleavage/methylation domain-containing protein
MKSTRGFTLIELLIVIALLGALAVGLLAAIDPFEQLKKGRDTSSRNTVSEFYNANLRYYSTKGQFPWGTSGIGPSSILALATYVTALQNAGELKDNFIQLAGTGNVAKMTLYSTGAEDMAVCFKPESKGFQIDPNTIYDMSGSTAGMASCKSGTGAGATSDCYYCIK